MIFGNDELTCGKVYSTQRGYCWPVSLLQAATKGYVDGLLAAKAGGMRLFVSFRAGLVFQKQVFSERDNMPFRSLLNQQHVRLFSLWFLEQSGLVLKKSGPRVASSRLYLFGGIPSSCEALLQFTQPSA
jgi:hypothetical protein